MVTYYAMNAGGNWGTSGTWSSVAAKDVSRISNGATPTNAIDCVIDDYSGNINISGTCNCKTLDCNGGGAYTGTLNFNNSTLGAYGNVTLSPTMTVAGTTALIMYASGTITCAGKTLPRLSWSGDRTITLADAMSVTYIYGTTQTTTFAGAFNITCDVLTLSNYGTIKIPDGQTITITSKINLYAPSASSGAITWNSPTISSTTPTTTSYIVYNGAIADQHIIAAKFTDINATGGTTLYNYQGGDLVRTSGITNIVLPPAGGASTCVGLIG